VSTVEELLPARLSVTALRRAAAECRACPLWEGATQTVFGEGPARARMVLVGEQPGGREDLEGHPFVGPAGRELQRGMEAAGIERRDVYLTNVVKQLGSFLPEGFSPCRAVLPGGQGEVPVFTTTLRASR
jgi:DNA polymerase